MPFPVVVLQAILGATLLQLAVDPNEHPYVFMCGGILMGLVFGLINHMISGQPYQAPIDKEKK